MSEGYTPGAGQPELTKPPHAVFISYSNEDKIVAESVCAALEASNIGCWIAPRDVQGGRPYSGQITQAIREARVLLLILTAAANRSKHVLREVERAAHCQNHLLTFRVEPLTPGDDLAYFLGADQWVDGFRPLPPSQHFPVLIQHAQNLLQRASAEQQTKEEPDPGSETFAHFRILRRPDGSLFKLGKGGMGVTYKAIDTTLNRPVALKVISAEQLNSHQAKHRFLREAQSAALIHHPHVATIFHFGEEADAYFYAMEFVEGEDLERYVARNGPLSPATVLRVALQVAQALEAAQARHLIHRDIKPANIMAVANRTGTLDVKLIDFGLAKGAGADGLDASRITRTQDFVGSPAFASPEQCETKKLDIRSDIYSLGVTLWYLLSGKRPFVGTVGEVMVAQIIKAPPFDQLTQTPEPVVSLLRRMLEKKPDDRFQTPEELQEAVELAGKQLSEDFGAVPERVKREPLPESEAASSGQTQPTEPVVLRTLDSPLLDTYLRVETGTLLDNRYRLLVEEFEGNGGRLFRAEAEPAPTGQPTPLAIKLLHPGIVADPTLLDLLESEVGVLHNAQHPNLVRYDRLERGATGPYLVREWVHGFLLYDLLRWRHSLKSSELVTLLDPLAATLDFVAGRGLGLVDVSVRKLLVVCPEHIGDFEALAKGNPREWMQGALKLNPLSLAPLLFRSRNGWDLQTIVPASRVLSMTQAQAGIRGTKAVQLYGRLVYELLSSRPMVRVGDKNKYAPLPELDQAGNEILRRACGGGDAAYRSCLEFWDALKQSLVAQPPRSKSLPAPAPQPLPERTEVQVSTPASPPQSPAPRRPKSLLIGGAIVVGAMIVGLAVYTVIRSTNSPAPVPSPAPSVTLATPSRSVISATRSVTTPAPTPSPMVVATPVPNPAVVPTPTPAPSANKAEAANVPSPTPIQGPGGGIARHNLTAEQYQEVFNEYVGNHGMQLVDVSGYGTTATLFVALWVKTASPLTWQARSQLTADDYQATFNELTSRGFSPVLVNGYTTPDGPRFVCIFQQGRTEPCVARHNMTGAQYQAAFDEFTRKGFTLEWVSGYYDGIQDLYAAIWRKLPHAPAWQARHGLTSNQYQAFFDEMVDKGYKPVVVSGYSDGTRDCYAAIFRKIANAPAWQERTGLSSAQYQVAFDELVGQGYRLELVCGYSVAGQDRFAAIWTK
jgi:serine/threonine protein kinase